MGWKFVVALALGLSFSVASQAITNRRIDLAFEKTLKIDHRAIVPLSHTKKFKPVNGPEQTLTGICTGIFLNPQAMLTAAHCINTFTETGEVAVEGIPSVSFFVPEEWDPKDVPTMALFSPERAKLATYDLGIVVFPPGTGEALGITTYPTLAKSEFQPGDAITLFGYGAGSFLVPNDLTFGYLGWTTTRIAQLVKETFALTQVFPLFFNLKTVTAGRGGYILPGDSGGPGFNDAGEIVATNSCVDQNALRNELQFLDISGSHLSTLLPGLAHSAIMNLKSKMALALYRKAVLCKKGKICAPNFENSGVPTSPLVFASVRYTEKVPSPEIWMKRGTYVNELNKEGKISLVPHYEGGNLVSVYYPSNEVPSDTADVANKSVNFKCQQSSPETSWCRYTDYALEISGKGERFTLAKVTTVSQEEFARGIMPTREEIGKYKFLER